MQKENFKAWLIAEGVKPKVAGDVVSRCKRIENALSVLLDEATATEEGFLSLMIQVHGLAVRCSKNTKAARALTGSLRASARKYALFRYGRQALSYPPCHGLTKYL